jgi:DNA-binding transcriptional ArsR family regulator
MSAELPASARTILDKLTGHSPMTGKQIREATGLPRRTIYTALRRLRALGMLHERQSLRDTRQTYFWLEGEEPGHAAHAHLPGHMGHPAAAAGAH